MGKPTSGGGGRGQLPPFSIANEALDTIQSSHYVLKAVNDLIAPASVI